MKKTMIRLFAVLFMANAGCSQSQDRYNADVGNRIKQVEQNLAEQRPVTTKTLFQAASKG
jgi:hypothetical protein